MGSFRLSIKHHLRRHSALRQAQSLVAMQVPSIWHFLGSLYFVFSIKHHLRRHSALRQAQSLAVVWFPCIWHFLDGLYFVFSIKHHLRRHSALRQAQSLVAMQVPSIWHFLDGLYFVFFDKLKLPKKWGAFSAICNKLLEEAQSGDDCRVLSLAAANLEECDDSENNADTHTDNVSNLTENGDDVYKYQQSFNNGELQSCADMEVYILGCSCQQDSDNKTDCTHQIGEHSDNLVIGDILYIELSGVIVGVDSGSCCHGCRHRSGCGSRSRSLSRHRSRSRSLSGHRNRSRSRSCCLNGSRSCAEGITAGRACCCEIFALCTASGTEFHIITTFLNMV